ncbi:fasciclin-like arabinogalactan protein 14 [Eucalyptus grandis]|uniref:fasciclin-like arabinogalactan protein 14 n=1 Tax=Eucalyptus grandis TaxID=71139 RepID=UPI00192E9BCF|nr:fasciclin-like arabinogalactan protein 14 [Eucalyptus grandis]
MSLNSLHSLLFLFFLLPSSATAFNITNILSKYPEFSTFNNDLTLSQVASAINARQSITVLAVDNSGMSALSGNPAETVKDILSLLVVLDYYDPQKLQQLPNKTAILTTLLQASGRAVGLQGFLNVTSSSSGGIAFGSAVQGSSVHANLVKSVTSQPFNISVLQISSAIVPPNIGKTNSSSGSNSTSSPPSPAPASPSPGKSPVPASSPTMSPGAAPPKSGKAPTPAAAATPPSNGSGATPPAASPSDAAAGGSPTSANAPATEAPVGSPPMPAGGVANGPAGAGADGPAGANGPAADDPAADAPGGNKSGAPRDYGVGRAGGVGLLVTMTWYLALKTW